jgi:vitamin B12 transporter
MLFIKKEKLFLGFILLILNQVSFAQIDSINYLKEVKVTTVSEQKATPMQTLGPVMLQQLQALQVSDAVKHFSGVTVKDYGGIGGLKTVSVRGLGAAHTGVIYDGLLLNDSQTGQIDIGKFSLDNIESISMIKGSPDNIFQPARTYSSSSLLSIKTTSPRFGENEWFKGRFTFKTGSFGLINPTLHFQNKLGKHFSTSISSEWQKANGKYPFVLENGSATSKMRRGNTDIESFRGEANIYGNFNESYKLFLKGYYYQSERGLPGATILYNSESSQRLWDKLYFLQSGLEARLTARINVNLQAKYSSNYQKYLDPDFQGIEGKLENEYNQREAYVSVSGIYKASESFHLSAAADWINNTMDANLKDFAQPTRNTLLSVIAGKWEDKHFSVNGNLLSTVIKEDVKEGDKPKNKEKYSPAITISFKPGNGRLLLRFFYKDIFRMPTFNDLYYTLLGSRTLDPESTQQFNLGLTYHIPLNKGEDYIYLTGDFYHNKVKNKIVAIPNRNLFVWSMLNLGEVDINGADFSLKSGVTLTQDFSLLINTSYTFQKVLDKTESSSKTYNDQVAYTPVHSGSGMIGLESKWADVSYNIIYSGSRYMLNQNIPANLLQGYTEHGVSASKNLSLDRIETSLKVDLLNMFNNQYEVVKNFPMPGRSVRISISAKF